MNIETTNEFPELEKYCLACGKELKENEQEKGFCEDCGKAFMEDLKTK